jgi:uncharacterized repeat protein (TIGR03803 family)
MNRKPSTGLFQQFSAVATLLLLTSAIAWAGPRYKVLHAFGSGSDGSGLWSSVVFGNNGELYGTTSGGGAHGYGTVFRLAPQSNGYWSESLLHSFPSFPDDGTAPFGGIMFDSASGALYGTTQDGGGSYTYGTVFKLAPGPDGWKETVLHRFGVHDRIAEPYAGVVRDPQGELYGTVPRGGPTLGGAVFELTPGSGGWQETLLDTFSQKNDGGGPFAGVILDAAGNLYGTTEGGGTYDVGTVYEVKHTSSGWKEQVLHSFDNNGKDGYTPGLGALIVDSSGALYGTTAGGGCSGCGGGVVFKLTPQTDGRWEETILYDFKGGAMGFEAGAGVVMDKSGNLYGTTIAGGSGCGCGVVYKLAPRPKGKWKYTVLHTFSGNDGAQPDANLILDSKGNLYGTTATGGAGGGVVFELTP